MMNVAVTDFKRHARNLFCDTSAGAAKGMLLGGLRLGTLAAGLLMIFWNVQSLADVGFVLSDDIAEEEKHGHHWVQTMWYDCIFQTGLLSMWIGYKEKGKIGKQVLWCCAAAILRSGAIFLYLFFELSKLTAEEEIETVLFRQDDSQRRYGSVFEIDGIHPMRKRFDDKKKKAEKASLKRDPATGSAPVSGTRKNGDTDIENDAADLLDF